MQHRCVNYFSARSGKIAEWDFARGRERIRVALPGSIAVNDSNAYVSAGLAGVGIVKMSTVMAGPMIAQGHFQLLLPEWTTIPMPIHVVYPQNRHLSTKVRVFTDWVAELLHNHPRMRLSNGAACRASSFPVASGDRAHSDSLG
ncbi:LysR substrate-binding domain-containing protein [Rugamonas sp. DEMB1]|uniref:LysR substrate-binding domain-containing protein n=1 Tax=Rugamonas sp. DEMB1 TaxID=3039386 RepID=UPI0028BF427C|nr:LysR substrate-binding domain-containing protein [Rugamonas sp. DEMB1]